MQLAAVYLSINTVGFTSAPINSRYRASRVYSIVCGITNLCTGRQTEVLFLSGASVAPVIRALEVEKNFAILWYDYHQMITDVRKMCQKAKKMS